MKQLGNQKGSMHLNMHKLCYEGYKGINIKCRNEQVISLTWRCSMHSVVRLLMLEFWFCQLLAVWMWFSELWTPLDMQNLPDRCAKRLIKLYPNFHLYHVSKGDLNPMMKFLLKKIQCSQTAKCTLPHPTLPYYLQ